MTALRQQVKGLEQDKRDLEAILEMTTEHADDLSEQLEQERDDLETILEMTTEHADVVEEELHERAEEAQRRSERQLRMIVEATPVPVVISRLSDRVILYANRSAGQLLNLASNALLSHRLTEFYQNPADWLSLLERLGHEEAIDAYEIEMHTADQRPIGTATSLRLIEFNDDGAILVSLYDITARKQAEQRLQQQVEELRLELDEARLSSQRAEETGTTRFHNLDAATIEYGATRLIAIHSFQGGNGKSSITANLAGLLAARGQRVGVIDIDIQSPNMHVLLGQAGQKIDYTLNDFLGGNCSIHQLTIDVTAKLGQPVPGQLFLMPSSVNPSAMAQVLSQGYEAQRLIQSFHEVSQLLRLDVLLIDTHPGLNEEALLAMRAAHTLVVILRPDPQDFEGTGVTVQVARKLEVPHLMLLVNQLPDTQQLQAVRAQVEQTYESEVGAILPQATEFMTFDGDGLFALRHPDHPISVALQHVTTSFIGAAV